VLLVSLERPIFLMRIMLWTGVPAAVLMAAGLAWLRPRLLFALAYGAILVLGLQSLERQYYAKMRKPRWKEAIQLVSDEYRKGAALLLVGGREHRQFKYYKRRKTDPIDTPPWHSTKASQALEKLPKMMESKDTLWLVHRRTKADTRKVIRKVRRKYRLRLHEKFGRGLQVRKYVRKKRKRKK
jgi:hypothetical protein